MFMHKLILEYQNKYFCVLCGNALGFMWEKRKNGENDG